MAEPEYHPVAHDHDEFLARAMRRKGFAAGDLVIRAGA